MDNCVGRAVVVDDREGGVVAVVISSSAANVVPCPTMVMAIAPSTPSMSFRMCGLLSPGCGAGPVPRSTMGVAAVGAGDRGHDFRVSVLTLRAGPAAPAPRPHRSGRCYVPWQAARIRLLRGCLNVEPRHPGSVGPHIAGLVLLVGIAAVLAVSGRAGVGCDGGTIA